MNAAGIKNPHQVNSSVRKDGRREDPLGGREHPERVNPFREYRLFPVTKLTHPSGAVEVYREEGPLAGRVPLLRSKKSY